MNNVLMAIMILLVQAAHFRKSEYSRHTSIYYFKKKYEFLNVNLPKELKLLTKNDSRLFLASRKKVGKCMLTYEYSYGVFADFSLEISRKLEGNSYDLKLDYIIVNSQKTSDSLPYFKIFDDELIYRIRTE